MPVGAKLLPPGAAQPGAATRAKKGGASPYGCYLASRPYTDKVRFHSVYLHFPRGLVKAAGEETERLIFRLRAVQEGRTDTTGVRYAHCVIPKGKVAQKLTMRQIVRAGETKAVQKVVRDANKGAKAAEAGSKSSCQLVAVAEICFGPLGCITEYEWQGCGGGGLPWPGGDDEDDGNSYPGTGDDSWGGGTGDGSDEGGGSGDESCRQLDPPPDSNCEPVYPRPIEEILAEALAMNPYLLLDVPCDQIPAYVELANLEVPQEVLNVVENLDGFGIAEIQRLQDAAGAVVNMDEFGVTMNVGDIPGGMTPEQFLREVRSNLNQYTDRPGVHFGEIVGSLDSADPLGTVVSISLDPTGGWIDEGSVVVSDRSSSHWTFSTVFTAFDGFHPVSGNRTFGFTRNGDQVTFFTRGVDRMTTTLDRMANTNYLAFDQADALWRSFQRKVKEATGGKATILEPLTYRPDWAEIEDVLNGDAPVSSIEGCSNSKMIANQR